MTTPITLSTLRQQYIATQKELAQNPGDFTLQEKLEQIKSEAKRLKEGEKMDSAHPASDYEDFDKPHKSQKLEIQNPEEQIITFGKHKGKKWKDLPIEYIRRIADSPASFFTPAIRNIAKYWFDKREDEIVKK